jgi:hypothetical protein
MKGATGQENPSHRYQAILTDGLVVVSSRALSCTCRRQANNSPAGKRRFVQPCVYSIYTVWRGILSRLKLL